MIKLSSKQNLQAIQIGIQAITDNRSYKKLQEDLEKVNKSIKECECYIEEGEDYTTEKAFFEKHRRMALISLTHAKNGRLSKENNKAQKIENLKSSVKPKTRWKLMVAFVCISIGGSIGLLILLAILIHALENL